MGGFLLVLVGGFGGMLLLGQLWPFPKQQGLTYVAHPTIALGGTLIAAIVFVALHLLKPGRFLPWLAVTLFASWTFTLFIWSMR